MRAGGLAVATVLRHWMGTLDFQVAYYDRTVDPMSGGFRGPVIFLAWHEYFPFLLCLRGPNQVAALLSRHHDAEWLSQAARFLGFGTVRGSTNRGGVAALRQLMRTGRATSLVITPDGPRGPRRRLSSGCIYLASRLGIPLVPIGLGYDRPWRIRRTWDRFPVPRLYGKARVLSGPRVFIPADLSRQDVERYRQRVEQLLERLTVTAERWAESNGRFEDQRAMFRHGMHGGDFLRCAPPRKSSMSGRYRPERQESQFRATCPFSTGGKGS